MKFGKNAGAKALAIVLALGSSTSATAQTAKPEKLGSAYVQCDGNPNNMSAGESAARLLGAITLLALFAPAPEGADPSKRKFGAEGVDICTGLIEGEKKETNAYRRINLILGRAIHRIEAKDYDGAVADAELARKEAEAGGFMANPYYVRSQARAFDLIPAAALYRAGKTQEARQAALRNLGDSRFLLTPLMGVPAYMLNEPAALPLEADMRGWRSRLGFGVNEQANRLEDWGDFKQAAIVREALVDFNARTAPELRSTASMARSAITLALAGDTALSDKRIAEARANSDKRRAEGSTERDASETVELFDLHGIIRQTQNGDVKTARRLFAARSQWVAASFGSVAEVTRRLRDGAAPDELIGGLSRDPAALWKDRLDTARAEALAKDSDNATLFRLIPGVDSAAAYRNLSKQVWRTDKSKLVLPVKDPAKSKIKMENMFLYGIDFDAVFPAYALHAALLAKSRGHQGFAMVPMATEQYVFAAFITGNKGEPGLSAPIFADADEVIAALSPVIPSPETIKAEAATKKKSGT
ncbi:hypothetical protein [Sphingomonas sp. LT1P40]|uniref:hypothetical protein n=1 Tax=Alteristakelama amylovorans TaxID=3096166 RepID=UPI002FCA99EC